MHTSCYYCGVKITSKIYRTYDLPFCSKDCMKKQKQNLSNFTKNQQLKGSLFLEYNHYIDGMGKKRNTCKLQCNCGNSFEHRKEYVIKQYLSNKTLSCGCQRVIHENGKNSQNWTGFEDISGQYFSTLKCKSRTKNIEFTITIEYLWDLFLQQDKKCALTDLELKFYTSRRIDPIQTASLDRIDSNKGYIEGNIQWLHKDINYMKRTYSQEHFIEMCNLVTQKALLL